MLKQLAIPYDQRNMDGSLTFSRIKSHRDESKTTPSEGDRGDNVTKSMKEKKRHHKPTKRKRHRKEKCVKQRANVQKIKITLAHELEKSSISAEIYPKNTNLRLTE